MGKWRHWQGIVYNISMILHENVPCCPPLQPDRIKYTSHQVGFQCKLNLTDRLWSFATSRNFKRLRICTLRSGSELVQAWWNEMEWLTHHGPGNGVITCRPGSRQVVSLPRMHREKLWSDFHWKILNSIVFSDCSILVSEYSERQFFFAECLNYSRCSILLIKPREAQ